MKVLVTGATGFMGIRLVKALLDGNYQVKALVRNRELADKVLPSGCEVVVGDVTEPKTLECICDDVDIVFHLAALMGHDLPSDEAFAKFRKVNVEGLKNIVAVAEKAKIKKFIHVSSTAAYGLISEEFVNEETTCKPYTPYQVTKREGELFVLKKISEGFPAIILRPSMIYGPGFKGDFLTMAKVCKKGFFPKIGCKENLSPALYIDDLIKIFMLALEKCEIGQLYLVSSSKSFSLDETAQIIGKALHKKVRLIYVPRWMAVFGAGVLEKLYGIVGKKPPVTQRNILSVTTNRTNDISKLCKQIDYVPEISLAEGLPKAIDYFRREKYL
ncbi:NAD-dependent epimerase/dehydratase family protein [Butyrivibrio fibrisolvens]|uniref:NAD-dependent epimerase/dehydratase family protein n=1 Tax=Butyrivibrio fibrisolvens TaxID=831 RepID=UPI0003F97283|nr:NAD-dependent epimerase/dehydratase family protein [Butyrivibrio fibrisolvens]